jgi:hypothetical protein
MDAPSCSSCGTAGRTGAKFCRHCGLPMAAAGGTTSRGLALPTKLPPLRMIVGAVVAVLVLAAIAVLARSTGDDSGNTEIDAATPDGDEEQLRAPTQVRLATDADACEADRCGIEVTFVDRSTGETGYVATFEFADGTMATQEGGSVADRGQNGQLPLRLIARQLPACVTVQTVGTSEGDASEPVCRMILGARGRPRLVEADDLVGPGQLRQGQCVHLANGQSWGAADQTDWFRVVPCGADAGTVFFRQAASVQPGAADERCAAELRAQQRGGRVFGFVAGARDPGGPAITCVVLD